MQHAIQQQQITIQISIIPKIASPPIFIIYLGYLFRYHVTISSHKIPNVKQTARNIKKPPIKGSIVIY